MYRERKNKRRGGDRDTTTADANNSGWVGGWVGGGVNHPVHAR